VPTQPTVETCAEVQSAKGDVSAADPAAPVNVPAAAASPNLTPAVQPVLAETGLGRDVFIVLGVGLLMLLVGAEGKRRTARRSPAE
jgi:hypothetical protein